jgi:hypothetical protein
MYLHVGLYVNNMLIMSNAKCKHIDVVQQSKSLLRSIFVSSSKKDQTTSGAHPTLYSADTEYRLLAGDLSGWEQIRPLTFV